MQVVGVVFVIIGFAFKVSAVPFHTWAPDTYEGAPTPVTAFLSVASKAAGFVGLIVLVYLAFPLAHDVYRPFLWVMAALTMTVGNLVALKQKNIVRMLAYSSISQGGFILMPLAMAVHQRRRRAPSLRAVVVYLIIYAATNLGAFAVIIAVVAQDPQRRDQQLRRPVQLRPRPHRDDDHLPRLARRHPAARWLVRQVRCLPGRRRRRRRLGLQHRRHRRRQRRHRHGVLHHRHARDVDEARARRRRHAHQGAGARCMAALAIMRRLHAGVRCACPA